MATYTELFNLQSGVAGADLRNRVAVAVSIQAHTYLTSGVATPAQKTWAARVSRAPHNEAGRVLVLLLAANNGATVAQITAVADAAIQTAVGTVASALADGDL
jgi:hypothetical protein